jgi:hypothetical protein
MFRRLIDQDDSRQQEPCGVDFHPELSRDFHREVSHL